MSRCAGMPRPNSGDTGWDTVIDSRFLISQASIDYEQFDIILYPEVLPLFVLAFGLHFLICLLFRGRNSKREHMTAPI